MFMRNRYNILFSLFGASLVLVGIETQAQENLKFAPNDIPVPWYSQKITGCPYTHCSLASSLMVFDYFKGMTADAQRTSSDAEKKLIEYQRNYFFKKRAPFRRRTSIGQGGYYSFEIERSSSLKQVMNILEKTRTLDVELKGRTVIIR